jgi:hypothetical protein
MDALCGVAALFVEEYEADRLHGARERSDDPTL